MKSIVKFILKVAAVAVAVRYGMTLLVGVVHADTGTPTPAGGGVDWTIVLLGAIAVLSGVRTVLQFLAPRTKTTLDDRALELDNRLLELLGLLRVQPPAPAATTTVVVQPAAPAPGPGPGTGAATMLAVLVLGVSALAASGCAASSRESTIKTAMVAVDASSAAFLAYDKAHQEDIVARAVSLEDGKAKLAAYREKQETVRKAFVVAYTAIGVAATVNDDHSIAGLQAALRQVLAAVAALTGGAP